MNNKLTSHPIENMRQCVEFFDSARKQLAENGTLHESYQYAFPNQFSIVRDYFEDNVEIGELGFERINSEYLKTLINESDEMINLIKERTIEKIRTELQEAFQSKRIRSKHNEIEFIWSYFYNGRPNQYSYTIKLRPNSLDWQVISGSYTNPYESGTLHSLLIDGEWH